MPLTYTAEREAEIRKLGSNAEWPDTMHILRFALRDALKELDAQIEAHKRTLAALAVTELDNKRVREVAMKKILELEEQLRKSQEVLAALLAALMGIVEEHNGQWWIKTWVTADEISRIKPAIALAEKNLGEKECPAQKT